MQDETRPWVDPVDGTVSSTVHPAVFAGTTIWLVVFGWYVLLHATPRFGLTMMTAAFLYAGATFAAGVCFGWGESLIHTRARVVMDGRALVFGGLAIASVTLVWFTLGTGLPAYQGGLWLGAVVLGAGIAVGSGFR